MLACVCRNISTNDYSSEEELVERIMQDDANPRCCRCQKHYASKSLSDGPDQVSIDGSVGKWSCPEQAGLTQEKV